MKFRRIYYDIFSNFYDKFIKLHSKDKNENLRKFLVNLMEINDKTKILDLCCGTGSNFKHFKNKNSNCLLYGIDFSLGMLKKAKEKAPFSMLVLGDVESLPFKSNSFNIILYTYAFYELKADKVEATLNEIKRVLTPSGKLYIMEHEIPTNRFIKILYFIRLASMGLKKAKRILSSEMKFLKKVFPKVEKIITPSGNSKIIICQKEY